MSLVIWKFQVKTGRQAEFEQVYGPGGDWAALFEQGSGYLGTDLLHDARDPYGYTTIDRWASSMAYEALRREWLTEYEALDAACAGLCEAEVLIGILTSTT